MRVGDKVVGVDFIAHRRQQRKAFFTKYPSAKHHMIPLIWVASYAVYYVPQSQYSLDEGYHYSLLLFVVNKVHEASRIVKGRLGPLIPGNGIISYE